MTECIWLVLRYRGRTVLIDRVADSSVLGRELLVDPKPGVSRADLLDAIDACPECVVTGRDVAAYGAGSPLRVEVQEERA